MFCAVPIGIGDYPAHTFIHHHRNPLWILQCRRWPMHPGTQTTSNHLSDGAPKELDLLYRISELVPSVDTSRERFLRVMEMLDEAFGKRYGTLTLLSHSKGKILLEVAFGDPSAQQGCIQGLDPAIIEEVTTRARPMVFSRMTQKPLPSSSKSLHEKDSALLCIPIMNNTQAVGVMSINPLYRDTVSFDRDIRLLKVIGCIAFQDAPLPRDDPAVLKESMADPPLDEILEGKLRRMIEKVDPRTESRCALLPDIVRLVEKIVIKWALKRHHDVQTTAALFLGINRNTLRKKMKDLNIHFHQS